MRIFLTAAQRLDENTRLLHPGQTAQIDSHFPLGRIIGIVRGHAVEGGQFYRIQPVINMHPVTVWTVQHLPGVVIKIDLLKGGMGIGTQIKHGAIGSTKFLKPAAGRFFIMVRYILLWSLNIPRHNGRLALRIGRDAHGEIAALLQQKFGRYQAAGSDKHCFCETEIIIRRHLYCYEAGREVGKSKCAAVVGRSDKLGGENGHFSVHQRLLRHCVFNTAD